MWTKNYFLHLAVNSLCKIMLEKDFKKKDLKFVLNKDIGP